MHFRLHTSTFITYKTHQNNIDTHSTTGAFRPTTHSCVTQCMLLDNSTMLTTPEWQGHTLDHPPTPTTKATAIAKTPPDNTDRIAATSREHALNPHTNTDYNGSHHGNELVKTELTTFEHQTSIGWHQLWYGRFSTWWMSLQDQHIRTHPHLPHKFTAEMFLEKLIGKIWDGLLLIWEHRNEIQHQADENDPGTTDRLKNQIQAIYEDASNLPALEQFPLPGTH